MAARLPDLGGVQRAATSHLLSSLTGKGTTPGQILGPFYCNILKILQIVVLVISNSRNIEMALIFFCILCMEFSHVKNKQIVNLNKR